MEAKEDKPSTMKINVREGDGENQKTKESYKPRGKAGFSNREKLENVGIISLYTGTST